MKRFLPLLALVALAACAPKTVQLIPASAFETQIDGKPVSLYTIRGGCLTAQVTNYGARVVSLWAPDRNGDMADVVIGYGDIDSYVHNPGERFLGSSPGPVANRIGGASFELDGETYTLDKNDGENTLHGGFKGIDHLVWDVVESSDSSILLRVVHPDALGGFPGNKTIDVCYTLTGDSALKVEFRATADAPTLMNLAHHPFFNLKGSGRGNILEHVLTINASCTTPVDSVLIPTGEIVSLDGSPLDFSGRFLEVLSDQPGLQFYSGNFFGDGKTVDKYGNAIEYRGALALETQKFPDSIHHPGFTDIVLRPGELYSHTALYRFSTR